MRRRHPEPAVPPDLLGYVDEMAQHCVDLTDSIRTLLVNPEYDLAAKLQQDDDAVDDVHRHLFQLLTAREWPHSTTSAVDVTLLSRFFERYADHCVNVAKCIIYLATGQRVGIRTARSTPSI